MAHHQQSLQQSAPGSKSSKFVNVNPLDPFVNPFGNENGGSTGGGEAQEGSVLAENLNRRLEDHVLQRRRQEQQLQQQQQQPQQQELLQQQQFLAASAASVDRATRARVHDAPTDDNLDSDSDEDDDDDPVLSELRDKRLQEMKVARQVHNQNLSRGHGEVRTISQDEFLPECLQPPPPKASPSTAPSSRRRHVVVVHFFHKDFVRCNIMDHHLKTVAAMHVECKFLRIDAEKAPFFVQRLSVRTLPTLLVFEDGQVTDRLVGFEGLVSPKASDPDQWKASQLEAWLARTGAVDAKRNGAAREDSDSDGGSDDDEGHGRLRRGIQRINVRHDRSRHHEDDD